MEKSLVESGAEVGMRTALQAQVITPVGHGWRSGLPVLRGEHVELREVTAADATALCTLLGAPEVQRFISPPPASSGAFANFIDRAERQRTDGRAICYVVTLRGHESPIGLVQMRETEPAFKVAEWGFAIGSAFWGTGVFAEAAELVMAFAFEQLGVHRLEARAAVSNARGTRALRKLGAVQEGVLRRSFLKDGEYLDQALFAIVEDDWRALRRIPRRMVH